MAETGGPTAAAFFAGAVGGLTASGVLDSAAFGAMEGSDGKRTGCDGCEGDGLDEAMGIASGAVRVGEDGATAVTAGRGAGACGLAADGAVAGTFRLPRFAAAAGFCVFLAFMNTPPQAHLFRGFGRRSRLPPRNSQ
jgi:hypothetical protein